MEDKMKKSMITLITAMMILSLSLFADNSFNDTMNKISVEYIKIKDTLVNDKTEEINENAKVILALSKQIDVSMLAGEHKEHFKDISAKISNSAENLSEAKDIKAMRKAFNDLSKPMAMWATMVKPIGINVAYCSMSPGSWLQTGDEIRNPYYGARMIKCGEIISMGEKEKDQHICNDSCEHSNK